MIFRWVSMPQQQVLELSNLKLWAHSDAVDALGILTGILSSYRVDQK